MRGRAQAVIAILFIVFASGVFAQADRQLEREIVSKEGPLDRDDLGELARISAIRPLEDATLERVIGKMITGLDAVEVWPTKTIFIEYQKHAQLPDEIYSFLVEDMISLSEISYVAADALQAMPEDDPRRSDAILALGNRLSTAADEREVLYGIAYLERFQRTGPLLDSSVSELVAVVLSRPEFDLRKRALDLAMTQDVGEADRKRLFVSLLKELETGDDPLSNESYLARIANAELGYILQALVSLSDGPYPPLLIDVLIAHFPRYATLALPVIIQTAREQGISDAQRDRLIRVATAERAVISATFDQLIDTRLTLFDALWPAPDEAAASAALLQFDGALGFTLRCKALYDVRRFYSGRTLPANVAEWLSDALRRDSHHELRYLGATMLLESEVSFTDRERWLLELIRQDRRETALQKLLLDAYDTNSLQTFVSIHATDQRLPADFRTVMMQQLGEAAAPGAALKPATEQALRTAVMTDTEIWLGSAESALEAWGIEAPLSDRQKLANRRETAGKVADTLFLVFTIVDPIVFFYGFIAIPLAKSGSAKESRGVGWSLLGWFVLAVIILFAWGFGLLASFGIHGGGAPPQEHFLLMLPFYLVSIVMLTIAFFQSRNVYRNYRNRRREVVMA